MIISHQKNFALNLGKNTLGFVTDNKELIGVYQGLTTSFQA